MSGTEPTPTPESAPGPEDPAPTEPRHHAAEGPSAVSRLLDGLRHPSRSQVVGGVLVGLLGFATVTQVHSRDADDQYAGLRSADLIQVLNGLNAQSRRADSEISTLEKTRAQLSDTSQRRQAATKRAKQEAVTLGILAGTLPTRGPGIRVTVSDPDDKVSLNNLLDGVEELRAAGAEAMEFNDSVRVVAETSFEQTDDGLVVDGRRLSAPYVIDVIGNPETLAPVLNFAEGFSYDVRASGGSVSVKKLDDVTISAVAKPSTDSVAKPRS